MDTKRFILILIAILLVSLFLCAAFIWPGTLVNKQNQPQATEVTQAQVKETKAESQQEEDQDTPAQECEPKPTVPAATDVPQTTTKTSWVLADTNYGEEIEWQGSFTFNGPAVCEWYKKDSPPAFGNEGFVFLMDDEQITFPKGQVGTCWNIADGNHAVKQLKASYRHLLFYSNQLTANDLAKLENYFYKWPSIKSQHEYMHLWLDLNDLGECTFLTQEGCPDLAEKVVKPPNGVQIEPTP